MLDFGSELRLLTLNPNDFVGFSNGPKAHQFFLTTTNSVSLYEITTQKPLASWNASFGQVLRTPVLYNSQDDSLLVAISDKTIIKWNTTEDIIDKGQKTTIAGVVRKIWPLKDNSNFVLEYDDDSVAFWSSPLQTLRPQLPTTHNVKLISVAEGAEEVHIVIISSGGNDTLLHFWTFNQAGDKINDKKLSVVHRIDAIPKNLHVAVKAQDTVKVIIFWSDGSFSSSNVNPANLNPDWYSHPPLEEIKDALQYCAAFLRNHVAIAISKPSGEGMCLMYSLKFWITVGKKILEKSSPVSKIVTYSFNDSICILWGNDLLILPYFDEPESLASLVGVQVSEQSTQNFALNKTLCWTSNGLVENIDEQDSSNSVKEGFSEKFLNKVHYYEKLGKSQHITCINVLRDIQNEKDFEMLREAFRFFRDFPESSIVDALHFYLSSRVNCQLLLTNGIGDVESDDYALIRQILTFHMNNTFLMDHLRRLPIEEVVFLLLFLHDILIRHNSSLLHPNQVITWISILVDSHFNKLVMSKDEEVINLLYKLHETVNLQCKLLEDLTMTQTYLELLLHSREDRSLINNQTPYCIETLIFE